MKLCFIEALSIPQEFHILNRTQMIYLQSFHRASNCHSRTWRLSFRWDKIRQSSRGSTFQFNSILYCNQIHGRRFVNAQTSRPFNIDNENQQILDLTMSLSTQSEIMHNSKKRTRKETEDTRTISFDRFITLGLSKAL